MCRWVGGWAGGWVGCGRAGGWVGGAQEVTKWVGAQEVEDREVTNLQADRDGRGEEKFQYPKDWRELPSSFTIMYTLTPDPTSCASLNSTKGRLELLHDKEDDHHTRDNSAKVRPKPVVKRHNTFSFR